MDYTHDELSSGLNFLTLSPRDGYTRGDLWIEVDALLGRRVVRVLEQLREMGGTQSAIEVVDNRTEFTSCVVVDQPAHQHQVALHFIERGEPKQIAFIESLKGKFRRDCLNQNCFVNLRDAWAAIKAWREDYGTALPYSSLEYLAPDEFAAADACGFTTSENGQRFGDGPISTIGVQPNAQAATS